MDPSRKGTPNSSRVDHAPEKKARSARTMLDGEEEWPIHANFDGFRFFFEMGSGSHHHDSGGGCGFGALFIDLDEGLVEDIGDVEIVVWPSWCDAIKIGASLRDVERALHAENLQRFSQREERRLELKLGQIQHDVLTLEAGAVHQQGRSQFAFQLGKPRRSIRQKDKKLKVVASCREL